MISPKHFVVSALLFTCSQLVYVAPSFCPGSGSEDETFIAPKASLETPSHRRGRPRKLSTEKEAPVKRRCVNKNLAASQAGVDSFVSFDLTQAKDSPPYWGGEIAGLQTDCADARRERISAPSSQANDLGQETTPFLTYSPQVKTEFTRNLLPESSSQVPAIRLQTQEGSERNQTVVLENVLSSIQELRDFTNQELGKTDGRNAERISNSEAKVGLALQKYRQWTLKELGKRDKTIAELQGKHSAFVKVLGKLLNNQKQLTSEIKKLSEATAVASITPQQLSGDAQAVPSLGSLSVFPETGDSQADLIQQLMQCVNSFPSVENVDTSSYASPAESTLSSSDNG